MLHRILGHCLSGFSGHRHTVRRKAAARPRSRPLTMEVLEDRVTPSTVTVTSSADSGPGSLRAVIASAPAGSTIVFAPPVHAITLTSGELAIAENLDIEGPGANRLTISGNDSSRVFHISGSTSVTIAGLTVAHGQSTGTLPQMGIFTGAGTGGGGGGGILNEAAATLTLNRDNFTNNRAVGAVGFTVMGGALLNLGTAHVQTCSFSNNQATGGGAFDAIGGSGGGAISNFGGPTGPASLTVADSVFSNNQAMSAGGGFYFGLGGALDSDAGLNGFDPTLAQPSTAMITNSAFLNNLATGGPNAVGNGGAINSAGKVMTLLGCTISGNRSVGGGGGDGVTTGDSEGVGGGIINILSTLNIDHCAITNNVAQGGDNAIISASDPFAGGGFGGGIENNEGGTLNISNSLIAGNIARGGATAAGPGAIAVGGGISNSAAAPILASMFMTNCVVTGNSAIGGQGGPGVNPLLAPGQQAGFGFGGGIDISHNGGSGTILGSLISGNSAVGGTGGTGNNGGDGLGAGIGVGWGDLVGQSPDGSQLTLTNSVVFGNVALGGTGGAGANGGNGLGGGLFIAPTASATLHDDQIVLNAAIGGLAGLGGSNGKGIGGGVYDDLGMFSADMLTVIAHNFASTSNNNVYP